MLIALWVVNGLLALAFLASGTMKVLRPKESLVAAGMAWTEDFSAPILKLIGLVEVLGAIGLVLPLLLGVAPTLTPIAALGLAIVMSGATVVHVRRKETAMPPVILGVLAAVSSVLGFLVLAAA